MSSNAYDRPMLAVPDLPDIKEKFARAPDLRGLPALGAGEVVCRGGEIVNSNQVMTSPTLHAGKATLSFTLLPEHGGAVLVEATRQVQIPGSVPHS